MRVSRSTGLLLSSLLVLPGLALVAGPASATDYTYDTSVVISAKPSATVVYQATLTLEGSVTTQDPSTGGTDALTDQTVTILRKLPGQKAWTQLGTATTDSSSGKYDYDVTATKNATYEVEFDGTTIADATTGDTYTFSSSSATRNVFVSRKLNESATNPAPHVYYFKGNVDPGWGNKTVYMQRKTCKTCAWRGYKSQRTTKSGAFKFRVDFPKKPGPVWYYRIKVPGGSDYITTYSRILSVQTVLV